MNRNYELVKILESMNQLIGFRLWTGFASNASPLVSVLSSELKHQQNVDRKRI